MATNEWQKTETKNEDDEVHTKIEEISEVRGIQKYQKQMGKTL